MNRAELSHEVLQKTANVALTLTLSQRPALKRARDGKALRVKIFITH